MRFMNLSKWNGQGYKDEAGGEDKGGAGGGEDKGGESDNGGGSVTLTPEEYKQFQTLLTGGGKPPAAEDKDKGKSTYDKILEENKKKDGDKLNEQQIIDNVNFDRNFDAFLDKNKTLFTLDAKVIRESARNLTGKALTDDLSKTAAKDFFSKAENLELLSERDQAYVKAEIINVNDKFIDPAKAWELVESAVHINSKQSRHQQFKNGGAPDSNETPNVTEYINRCINRGEKVPA